MDYPDKFRKSISSTVKYLLAQVTEVDKQIDEHLQGQVLHVLSFALNSDIAWPETSELLLKLTPEMDRIGQWRTWLAYLEQGAHQSKKREDQAKFAEMTLNLGIFYRSVSQYEEAEKWLQASLAAYEELDELHNTGKVLNRLAFLARLRGQVADAESNAMQAMGILNLNDDEHAVSYSILGTTAYDKHEWSASITYYEQAISIYERNDNLTMKARVLGDLAIVQGALDMHDIAITTFTESLALLDELHLPVRAAITKMNLGSQYLTMGHPEQALTLYNEAEPVLRSAHDLRRVAFVLSNQGIAYRELGQDDLAIESLNQGLEFAQQTSNYELLVNTYDELGVTYRQQNLEDEAQTAFHNAQEILGKIENLSARNHYTTLIKQHIDLTE